jgi:hypothetical protein
MAAADSGVPTHCWADRGCRTGLHRPRCRRRCAAQCPQTSGLRLTRVKAAAPARWGQARLAALSTARTLAVAMSGDRRRAASRRRWACGIRHRRPACDPDAGGMLGIVEHSSYTRLAQADQVRWNRGHCHRARRAAARQLTVTVPMKMLCMPCSPPRNRATRLRRCRRAGRLLRTAAQMSSALGSRRSRRRCRTWLLKSAWSRLEPQSCSSTQATPCCPTAS